MDCMALYKWIRWLYFHGLGGSATVEYSICKRHNVPLIVCAGKVNIDSCYEKGITACFSIGNEISSLEKALKDGEKNLEKTSENIMRLLLR